MTVAVPHGMIGSGYRSVIPHTPRPSKVHHVRTLARSLLLPGLTALALTATGCSSTPHTGAAEPAGTTSPTPAADGVSQQLDVAAAPQASPRPPPWPVATRRGGPRSPH